MAMCVMAAVGEAPCQCFSPGANQTISPGRRSSTGPFPLRTTGPRHDKKCLPERVGVPGCARARLEGDRSATNAGRSRSGERRVNSHRASEIVGRAFGRGLGSVALDIQCRTLSV